MAFKLFVHQEPVEEEFILGLSAGIVSEKDGKFLVTYEQKGAEETFTIGQPIYDSENNLMGYLDIGLWDNLDYAVTGKKGNEDKTLFIPSEFWGIGKPTKYCEIGKQVFTYWQRWNKEDKQ